MGKEGLEPSRIAARDPKSRLSANFQHFPGICSAIIREGVSSVNDGKNWALPARTEYNYAPVKPHAHH